MPRKKKLDHAIERLGGATPLPAGVIDQLVTGPMTPGDLDAMFKQLKKALLERALGAELTHHLGYEKGDPAGRGTGNNRNGSYAQDGADRGWGGRDRGAAGPARQLRAAAGAQVAEAAAGFDDKIIALYARGMTVREIQALLERAIPHRGHRPTSSAA